MATTAILEPIRTVHDNNILTNNNINNTTTDIDTTNTIIQQQSDHAIALSPTLTAQRSLLNTTNSINSDNTDNTALQQSNRQECNNKLDIDNNTIDKAMTLQLTLTDYEPPIDQHSQHNDNIINDTTTSQTTFTIPSDWPAIDSAIDLSIHDHAHKSSDTEWWYINTHCYDKYDSNKQYSIFVSFFRIIKSIDDDNNKQYAHAFVYSICDIHNKQYYSNTLVDYQADIILKQQLENNIYKMDHRFKQALLEILNKGNVPKPDHKMNKQANCSIYDNNNNNNTFLLEYDGNTLTRLNDNSYQLTCKHTSASHISIDLNIQPTKPVIRQANDGIVKVGLRKDTMYYYFIPRCNVNGYITLNNNNNNSIELNGTAWYDHEFGGTFRADMMVKDLNKHINDNKYNANTTHNINNNTTITQPPTPTHRSYQYSDGLYKHVDITPDPSPTNSPPSQLRSIDKQDNNIDTSSSSSSSQFNKRSYAWNWFAIQLDNEIDITVTQLIDIDEYNNQNIFQQYAIVVDSQHNNYKRTEHHNINIKSSNNFVSTRTTNVYPLDWIIEIPDLHIKLQCNAVIADQEVITLISKPAFWEGVMNINAAIINNNITTTITGKGWLERQGFNEMRSLKNYLKNASLQTIAAVDQIMPVQPSYEQARELIADSNRDYYMSGVNLNVYSQTITKPLRDIIDRGGKSWRSLACLLCIDAVGGQSSRYRHWLSMPEIMHVGSLIIDDIQDNSTHRRGGDACHIMYGNALAINTGCAAYFLALNVLNNMTPDLTAETRLRLYELYFLGLRAGHTGQGFDLYGFDYMMSHTVETGDNNELVRTVLCTHRLKSAVPAGCLARMGATIGQASDIQVESLGSYFESIGLAFQIIDDVLNINGFAHNKKDTAEDIKAGKITYPIAVAMNKNMLNTVEQRQQLWSTIQSKPTDDNVISDIVKLLNDCGAIEHSVEHATKLVNDAWLKLDAELEDSFYKMVLRAFGLYVLERRW